MHLSDAKIVDIISGKNDVGGEEHLRTCDRCNDLAKTWKHHLGLLNSLEAESVTEGELHRLGAIYRTYGPQPQGVLSWVATLVRSSAEPAAAVRGASEQLVEYAAGPFRIILHITPHDTPQTVSIHGQLFSDDPESIGDGRVALVADNGASFVSEMNRFGEFHLSGVCKGTYSASWWPQTGQIHIPKIDITTDDAD